MENSSQLTDGMIMKGDQVLALGFSQIWLNGDFPCDASEIEGIEELDEIDMKLDISWFSEGKDTTKIVQWISVSGEDRVRMTK